MAEPKTKPTSASVKKFIDAIENSQKRADAFTLLNIFMEVTEEKPVLWGSSIIGFGSYQQTYASGRKGVWPLTGFSPRKQNFSLYIMSGFNGREELLQKIGSHKHSVACLYIKSLKDIHIPTLKKVIRHSVKDMKNKDGEYGC